MISQKKMPPLIALLALAVGGVPVAHADIITDWNQITCQTIQADTTMKGPTWSSRNLAMVHSAMYDAVNSIDRGHTAYRVMLATPAGTSEEAAAAQAAYKTLVTLYPGQKTALDAALANSLASIANGAGKSDGIALGNTVAQKTLDWRSTDGSSNVYTYNPTPGPGIWSPDPLHPQQTPLGVGWGNVTPFAIQSGKQFMPGPPPALDSAEYTAAYNEVKEYGAKNSSVRTADQTQIGIFWAYDRAQLGPPTVLYNTNLREIAAAKGNTMAQNARLFALANIGMADAGISCWEGKYTYNFWRPITAIRGGDTDGNPDTVGDPNWAPLGAPGLNGDNFTPGFPAYASGHATFGGVLFTTLADFYGTDNFDFSLTSDELPGVTRYYHSFSQASEENAQSRIYLGVHWSFDKTQGVDCGNRIGNYVYSHELAAVPEPGVVSFGVLASGSVLGMIALRRRK